MEAPGDRGSGRGLLEGCRAAGSAIFTPRSQSWIFYRAGPVGAVRDGGARPPGAEPEPSVPPSVGRALIALLRAEGGERGDVGDDAADRRDFPEVSAFRRPSDGASPALRGRADRPTPGRPSDAPDDLSGAGSTHICCGVWQSNCRTTSGAPISPQSRCSMASFTITVRPGGDG